MNSEVNQAEVIKLTQSQNAIEQDVTRTGLLLNYAQLDEEQRVLFSPGIGGFISSSINEFDEKMDGLRLTIKSLEAEKFSTSVNVRKYKKVLPLIKLRKDSLEKLNNQSLVSNDQYMQLQQEYIEQQEALAYEEARTNEILARIEGSKQKQDTFVAEFIRQKNTELNRYERELEGITQELNKALTKDKQQQLHAPESGVIESLAIYTIGGVVTPAQALMQLVPLERELIVEAGLANKDIGFVRKGQIAEIKLEAFPFMKYGVIHGEISNVSTDAIEHERLGLVFPLKVVMHKGQIVVNGSNIDLQAGMQVTVEVKTGERRIIEFLLAPVLRGLDEGIRER